MMRIGSFFAVFFLLLLLGGLSVQARQDGFLQSGRMTSSFRDPNALISSFIDDAPWRPVPGISDREYWTLAAASPGAAELIQLAEKDPVPEKFAGDEQMALLYRLSIALPAACLSGKDAHVEKVLQLVQALMNIEDWRGVTSREEGIAIDERSSLTALNLCWARVLLDDRMPSALGRNIDRRIRFDVVDPLLQVVSKERKADPWATSSNLDNIYCSYHCSLLVLLQSLDPQYRYDLLRWLLPLSLCYLDSLGGGDGFEPAGAWRWNQGFSAYMDKSLVFYLASHKKLDLMKRKSAIDASDFPETIQLFPGYYPTIGESDFQIPFDPFLIGYRDLLCGYAPDPPELVTPAKAAGNLSRTLMLFAYQPDWSRSRKMMSSPCGAFFLRQILLCRPGNFHRCRLHAVFKGGSCREEGGHSDVGSFIVVLDEVPMLVDPGPKMPEARCHSVPCPGRVIQRSGSSGSAEVSGQKFFNSISEVSFNLAPVYRSVFGLQKLVRTCVYDRNREGSVTISDDVTFRTVADYESAAIAEGEVKVVAPDEVLISREGKTLRLTADAGKIPVEVELIPLANPADRKLVRVVFRLKKPAKKFTFRLKAEPADAADSD